MPVRVLFGGLGIGLLALIVWGGAMLDGYARPSVPFYSLSWELADAPQAATANARVSLWIREHRSDILHVARVRLIDPRAIAGVIAYEALADIQPPEVRAIARYSGPGKVHYRSSHFFEGEPIAKSVEEAGYLPRQTMLARKRILSTDHGAIVYIGAILADYATVARSSHQEISCRIDMLMTFYSAWSLTDEDVFLRSHRAIRLRPNYTGAWGIGYSEYLSEALGLPSSYRCRYSDFSLKGGVRR